MNNPGQWREQTLTALLAGLLGGCASCRDLSPTANLWQKDNTGTLEEHAGRTKYICDSWTRATLTPLAVVGDAAILGAAAGTAGVIIVLADKCGATPQLP